MEIIFVCPNVYGGVVVKRGSFKIDVVSSMMGHGYQPYLCQHS